MNVREMQERLAKFPDQEAEVRIFSYDARQEYAKETIFDDLPSEYFYEEPDLYGCKSYLFLWGYI